MVVCHISVCEEVTIPAATVHLKRPARSGRTGERKGGRDSHRVPISSHSASPKQICTPSPNVVIEEIIEETIAHEERVVMRMYAQNDLYIDKPLCSVAKLSFPYFCYLRPGAQAYSETKGTEEESQGIAGQDCCLSKWW